MKKHFKYLLKKSKEPEGVIAIGSIILVGFYLLRGNSEDASATISVFTFLGSAAFSPIPYSLLRQKNIHKYAVLTLGIIFSVLIAWGGVYFLGVPWCMPIVMAGVGLIVGFSYSVGDDKNYV